MSSELESDVCYRRHLVKATEVTAESNGSLTLGGWISHIWADCLYTGISSAGPALSNDYGRTLPF